MDYTNHLKSAADLVTLRTDTSAGFIKMSLERSLRATPHVEQGRALRAVSATFPDVASLLSDPTMHEAILTAAGVSEKAKQYFQEADKQLAMSEFAEKYLQTAGNQFVDELVLRFMLTRGETLGGTMKNVVGYLAEVRLQRAIIAALTLRGQPFKYLSRDSGRWLTPQASDPDIERNAKGLSWNITNVPRTLLTNVGVPQVKKNVDLCLFECPPEDVIGKRKSTILNDISKYIALGELKGGIDPAGADEHWKTARSALNRLRVIFDVPAIFFVGAAIEASMSREIWADLENGTLKNAANLNHDDQVASFVSWLVSL